jgi:hypothetical protein
MLVTHGTFRRFYGYAMISEIGVERTFYRTSVTSQFAPQQTSDLQCNQLAGCRLTSRREIDYPAVLRSLAVTGCSSIN